MTARAKLLTTLVAVGLCLVGAGAFVSFMQVVFYRSAPPYPTSFVGRELAAVVEELTSQQCRITADEADAAPTTLRFDCPDETTHEIEADEDGIVIEQQTFNTRDDGKRVYTTYALGEDPMATYWDE